MGNTEHGNAHPLRRWLVAAALAGLSLIAGPAFAERVSRSEFNAFMDIATGATKHTVGISSNGVPLATRGVPGATASGNMNFAHSAGAWPTANATVDIPSPISGKTLTATAKQSFSKASQAAALGRFAAKVVTPIAVGVAIYDLIREVGPTDGDWEVRHRTATDGPGDNFFYKTTSGMVCLSGCKEYRKNSATYPDANSPSSWDKSLVGACSTYNSLSGYAVSVSGANGPNSCLMVWSYDGSTYTQTVPTRDIAPYDTRTRTLMSESQFVSELAAESGWPSNSAIDKALADMMNSGLVDLQNSLNTENAAAISAASTKVVSDPKTEALSDGTTKTTTTTCEWVQGIPPGPLEWRCWDNTTTVTPQKTTLETVTKTNPDGTTTTETITKTTPSTTTTGTTTATASELNQKLCPDGTRRLACADLDTVTQDMPKSTHTVTYAADNLGFGGGSCPAPYAWSDSMGSHSVDLAPLCERLTSVVRPLVIAFSLLLAVFIVLPRET